MALEVLVLCLFFAVIHVIIGFGFFFVSYKFNTLSVAYNFDPNFDCLSSCLKIYEFENIQLQQISVPCCILVYNIDTSI